MNPQESFIIADTHVHLHRCFSLDLALDSARDHFERFAPAGSPHLRLKVLCLTDIGGEHSDVWLCDELKASQRWEFRRSQDGLSVCARSKGGDEIHLLPGRQIVTAENLEVLALNCQLELQDRAEDMGSVLRRVREAGGAPVVPWGFGKWSGQRGSVVRELVRSERDFLLADNGNRLRWTSEPALLREGRRQHLPVLAGSDPLPFATQARRVGSYGIYAESGAAQQGASAAFRELLNRPEKWCRYGVLAGFAEFVICQARMQLLKRGRKRA